MAVSVKDKPKFKWRVKEICDNCPFMDDGAGRQLRDSLRPARWAEILHGVLNGQKFDCHKTTDETGNGTNLYCAGALKFQKEHGIETDYMRLCESFEQAKVRETKEDLFKRLQKIVRAGIRGKPTGGSRTHR